MNAKLTWKSGIAFTGLGDSNQPISLDSPVEKGGGGDGVTPMEMILIGLGGCTGMDVISILAKKRQAVSGFEIQLHGDRSGEHPMVFTDISIEYVVKGKGIDPEAVARAIELSETKYCSVMAMLQKAANINTTYRIVEG